VSRFSTGPTAQTSVLLAAPTPVVLAEAVSSAVGREVYAAQARFALPAFLR